MSIKETIELDVKGLGELKSAADEAERLAKAISKRNDPLAIASQSPTPSRRTSSQRSERSARQMLPVRWTGARRYERGAMRQLGCGPVAEGQD